MKTTFNMSLALALVCLVVCASAVPSKKDNNKGTQHTNKQAGKLNNGKNERNEKGENDEDDDPKNCREPMEQVESCCNVPSLLPRSAFQSCADSMPAPQWGPGGPEGASTGVQAAKQSGSKKENAKQQKHGRRARSSHKENEKSGGWKREHKGEKRGPGGRRGGPCMMDCVFKNQSLYSADGSINVAAVTTLLTSNVSATWAPVVQTAITSCSAGVAGMDMSGMPPPPPGAPKCSFSAGVFMRCLKRQLILSCPADSQNTTVANCTAKMAAVQACDPFSPPKPHHKEGGPVSSEEQGGNMKAGKQSAKKGGNKNGKMASKKQSVKSQNQQQEGGNKPASSEERDTLNG